MDDLNEIMIDLLSIAEGLHQLADELGDEDRYDWAGEILARIHIISRTLERIAPEAVPPSLRRTCR